MPKKSKKLDLSTVCTVDETGAVVGTGLEMPAAPSVARRPDLKEVKVLSSDTIETIFGSLVRRVLVPFEGYANASTFGNAEVKKEWHVSDHWKIMGFLNGLGSMRCGHYRIVEEGLHLKQTFETIRAEQLYEGTFGYVKFPTARVDFVQRLASRGLLPNKMGDKTMTEEEVLDSDLWFKYYIKDQKVSRGHWVNPRLLEDIARDLGKPISKLSPVTLANHKEAWNTYHKRQGVEAALRAMQGTHKVIVALKLERDSDRWQLGTELRRSNALLLPVADLAAIMNGAANDAEGQLDADQDAYATQEDPTNPSKEEAAGTMLAVYGGEQYPASKLAGAAVIKVRGEMEVGTRIYLRDTHMVLRQFAQLDEGTMFKVLTPAK